MRRKRELAYRGSVRPSRCAYAMTNAPQNGTNFGFISLYNDSVAPYVLAVHDTSGDSLNAISPAGWTVQQGIQGSNPVNGNPMVTGRQRMQGQVYQGNLAVLPTMTLPLLGPFGQYFWPHEFPFIVLTPGWSLTMYGNTAGSQFDWGFIWQVLTPDELDEFDCP